VPPRRRLRSILIFGFLLAAGGVVTLAIRETFDARSREALARFASSHYSAGTLLDLEEAALRLEQDPSLLADERLRGALALIRAQEALEFGEHEREARDAIAFFESVDDMPGDARLAKAMMATSTGHFDDARELLQRLRDDRQGDDIPRARWLSSLLDLAQGPVKSGETGTQSEMDEVVAGLEALVQSHDGIAYRRLLVRAQIRAGRGREALIGLQAARERSPTHAGLAADEALYNAMLRQKLTGVADLSEQILAASSESVPRFDRAHARLARGVVYVLGGQIPTGMELVGQAWSDLPLWDVAARQLALDMALEAGDEALAQGWLTQVGLRGVELDIYRAWQLFVAGDIMGCLELCTKLPQDHPRIALLQGLALVEQQRLEEAEPWLLRAEKLNPGRVEVEIALARVEVALGDRRAALRKLEVLAEDEPFAARVWTGLGEAHLALANATLSLADERELNRRRAQAEQALERALERERRPAEAMVRLAEIWDSRRKSDSEAAGKALALFEKAAQLNDRLPRYRERLALYLAQLGFRQRSLELLANLTKEPGVKAETLLAAIGQSIDALVDGDSVDENQLDEYIKAAKSVLGAENIDVRREEARRILGASGKEGAGKALMLIEAILTEKPGDVRALVLKARAIERMGDRDRAIDALRLGLRHVPRNDRGLLYAQWARDKAAGGHRQGAAGHARIAWQLLSEQSTPASELISVARLSTQLYLQVEKVDSARRVALELTKILPFHSEAWTVLANVSHKAGESPAALRSAAKAVELEPTNPRALEILGLSHLRLGSRVAANQAFTRALEHSRDSSMRDRLTRYIRDSG
jgi:tetratricopeptide (TPR) repeat protein